MRSVNLSLPRLLGLPAILLLACAVAWPQAAPVPSRIVDRVDENSLVTLRGNTHPLAQSQFDRGPAPPDLPMARMLLVLKRSDAQEAALEKLLDDQQGLNSPSYHQWLTPDQFGQQFGPSSQDVQAVVAWLRSHGFQIGAISAGLTVIEFSGTAAQVQQAFHTEIRKFTVNGEDHWANAGDPQIPAALAPVVAGVNSLHNFPKEPLYRFAGQAAHPQGVPFAQGFTPNFTISASRCAISGNCYFVGPYDFATIYNLLPLWNATPPLDGTGQSIAILNESNINIQDARDFRNMFGLPSNDPQVILNGPDPGLVPGIETEADLDVEWSGAVAKGATIKLVVSASTYSTAGVDLSSVYAVENSVAPVISESFGECELFLGNAGNGFQNAIRQQAAAQGITFIVSSGDQGSATCDVFQGNPPQPATYGLAISGLASTPYNVAVGGTDFENFGANFNFGVASPYWSLSNNAQQASALGYVPETTWNSNCTNNVFSLLHYGVNPEADCNNADLSTWVETEGGSGGNSSCVTSDGADVSSCTGGYGKPVWQSAPGVPADAARDIPDVSLFASPGFMDSAYILCESDQLPVPQTCSLSSAFNTFLGVGGTSASAPSFAGIVAIINQFTNSSGQGNANYVLYKMASSVAQTSQQCGATSSPSASCIFYDVTAGTITAPCAKGSPNCDTSNASDAYGVLAGYAAGVGYDLAAGLGSVNAGNLAHNWIQAPDASTTTLSLNSGNGANITHGQSVNFAIVVTPSAATGVVSLEGTPTGAGSVPMASFPLKNGAVSGTTAALAGGTAYSMKAHYSGDGTYKPSDSTPITVTVSPEPSKTLITLPTYNLTTGMETGNTPTSISYGTFLGVRVDVGNSGAKTSFPAQIVCPPLTCPTGTATVTDSFNAGAAAPLPGAGTFTLNSGGFSEFDGFEFAGGSHQISASYPGDGSYQSSIATYNFTVTPAPMQLSFLSIPASPPVVGVPVNMYATFEATNSFPGAGPTGTITFYDGTTQIPGTVTYSNGQPGGNNFAASLTGYVTATFATIGPHQITAKYSGDANFAAATGSATSAPAVYATTVVATASPSTVNFGQVISLTVTVAGASKNPPMTGTFQFSGQFTGLSGPVTPAAGTDANGNQTLTATVTLTPQTSTVIYVYYPGDANYESNEGTAFVTVNIPDFSLNIPPGPLLISAGQPGSIVVTVVPASSMASTVSLSCGGMAGGELPGGYSCAFSPTSLNLSNGASTTSTFSLALNSPVAAAMGKRRAAAKPGGLSINHLGRPNGFILLAGLLAWVLVVWPVKWPARRARTVVFIFGVICLAVGCGGASIGGGGTSGGGGTPPPTPQPTTITVSASAAKVPASTPVNFTATVQGSNNPTGTVLFYLNGNFTGSANLVGNTAVASGEMPWIGAYSLTAQYTGDPLNNPSTSAGVNLAITGTSYIGIQGETGTDFHISQVTYTIQ